MLVDSVALPKDQQSFDKWFDNSSTALNNPRPDGTFAWTLLGTNEYRVAKQRFHDVNEPSEPQWSVSFFKSARLSGGANVQFRFEDVQRLQRPRLRRAEHQPEQREFRDRQHREPGEFPADDSAGGARGVLTTLGHAHGEHGEARRRTKLTPRAAKRRGPEARGWGPAP